MSRTYLLRVFSLAVVIAVASFTTTLATEKVVIEHEGFQFVDPSTNPPTPLQDVAVTLNGAHAGTMQNPGSTLPSSSSLGIVNPDPAGFGDAAFFDVFYAGAPGDFPARSFFDVFTEMSDPNTGQPAEMKSGVVKFFNEAKGFGMVVSGHVPGSPEYFYSLTGEINPAQSGLSFADVPVVPGGGPPASFFDIFTELQFNGPGAINPNLPLFEITLTSVPEPSTIVLAAMAVVALMAVARKKRLRSRIMP